MSAEEPAPAAPAPPGAGLATGAGLAPSGGLAPGAGLAPHERAQLATAASEFSAATTYLNTATYGLPPRRSWEALQQALEEWRTGRAEAAGYDAVVERCRQGYARLVGADPSTVAIGATASSLVGLVAASLPRGAEVLTAEGDFTSVLFPFHVQAGRPERGITVREAPLDRLADAVDASTALVAVSAVQSADGRVVDLDRLVDACAAGGASGPSGPNRASGAAGAGTRILLDLTQAAGWLPIEAGRFAYTVAAGYKWLLAPRGTAYLTVAPDLLGQVAPLSAGWYAGQDRWDSIYGGPLRLASDARRLDLSPAWHSWVGAAPALDLLLEVGVAGLQAHALELAARFCAGAGLPPPASPIVSVVAGEEAARRMEEAQLVAAVRAGRLRLSFHVNNTDADVDRALEVLAGHVHA